MNKKIILPTVLAMAVLTVGILAKRAYAEEISRYPTIVQKIADRFNVPVSQVAEVFDEDRDERRADMYARFAERLNDLVSEDELTETQKEAILERHEEMHNNMEVWKDLNPEEKREKIKAAHEEFRNWVEEQGLDLGKIGPFGFRMDKGMGMRNEFFLEKLD